MKEKKEEIKASLLEEVLYIEEGSLPEGEGLLEKSIRELEEGVRVGIGRRYDIEEDESKRQPIPYVLIKKEKKYYMALRGKGSGESRLHGKLGLLGGHISKEDVYGSLEEQVRRGMYRELEEEVGLKEEQVKEEKYIGVIRLKKEGVERHHLGLLYELELKEGVEIESREEDVKGKWLSKEEIEREKERLEDWARLVYEKRIEVEK